MAEVAEAFNEMTETLEQSERQRQNMVADVAHELKNPLSSVRSAVESMALTKDEDVQARLLG